MPKACAHPKCNYLVFSRGLCRDHWLRNYGKPIKKTKQQNKRQSPIAQSSQKQKQRLLSYKPVRDKYLKDNPACGAKITGCTKKATQVHHKKGKIGNLLFDDEYFLPCCGSCHRIIEDNPAMAIENGFTLSRHKINNER